MMGHAKYILPVFTTLFLNATSLHAQEKNQNKEIIYHVVQRSFYDSNGDLHGDLNGLKSKLDYLQELGMYGSGGFGKFGNTDGNDIPMREAFEWNKSDSGKGMALWYKNSGPWWDSTNLHPDDGISLEEERNNPNSLWNFYKQVIKLRQSNEALTEGKYKTLQNDNPQAFSFLRYTKSKAVAVVLNLSDVQQKANVNISEVSARQSKKLFGTANATINNSSLQVDLPAYGAAILQLQ